MVERFPMLGVGTSETIVVVLIILIISIIVRKLARGWRMVVFVSDKVRVHFMRKEKDQRRE